MRQVQLRLPAPKRLHPSLWPLPLDHARDLLDRQEAHFKLGSGGRDEAVVGAYFCIEPVIRVSTIQLVSSGDGDSGEEDGRGTVKRASTCVGV
jgi:hypothetical protein